MNNMYVRLENAENVALDEYWNIGETTTLGKLSDGNMAKILTATSMMANRLRTKWRTAKSIL